jgi:YesN/AraC family two-component response regulator
LTGYPAFETALQAIRQQVDDYFVKPADIRNLVETVKEKLHHPNRTHSFQSQSVADFLREHTDEIVSRTLDAMKQRPRLSRLPLSDKERRNHLTHVVLQLAASLMRPAQTQDHSVIRAAAEHGEAREQQGYSPTMLVDDVRVLGAAIYAVVQENLLNLHLSSVIPDLCRINDSLEEQLQEALKAFLKEEAA